MTRPYGKWTDDGRKEVWRLKKEGFTARQIADLVGTTKDAVEHALSYIPYSPDERDCIQIPGNVWDDRNRRLEIPPRDLTAAIAGDPLPGYSALERRA